MTREFFDVCLKNRLDEAKNILAGIEPDEVPELLGVLVQTYKFDDREDELSALIPLFAEKDFTLDTESLKRLLDHGARMHSPQSMYNEMLIDKCPDINEVDRYGQTALHYALSRGIEPFAEALLARGTADLNLADYENRPPLYYACKNASGEIVRSLLQAGADMDVLCGKMHVGMDTDYFFNADSTPLVLAACTNEDRDVLKVLLEFGADINAANDKGVTPLHAACLSHNTELAAFLLENGADVSARDAYGDTPLHILVRRRDKKPNNVESIPAVDSWRAKRETECIKLVDMLIENGADIEALNINLRTPFFVSAYEVRTRKPESFNIPILKHLLSLGAAVNPQDINGVTCLHNAVSDENSELVKFLLESGADSSIQDNKDESPYQMALRKNKRDIISRIEKNDVTIEMDGDDLDAAFMRACSNGSRGVAEMLVKKGNVDLTYVDNYGRTPLHHIAGKGMTALAKFVIDSGVDINYTDNFGQTALHFATGKLHKEVFKLLVNSGADINIADNKGVLPIHLIANRGQHDMLELLLDKGADPAVMTNIGQSLLHAACYTRSRECVRVLLERGIDPNILDKTGITPLIVCANINQKEIAKMLLAAGADVKARDLDGDEAIHICVIRGFKDMLDLLIRSGSDVDSLNNGGLAPLHLAAYLGFKDLFKFLLDKGADFDVKTREGKTCVDIAAENGQKELVELIGIIRKRRQMTAD